MEIVQIKPRFKSRQRRSYERLNIVITILLAGWVPSILTLVISYTILTNTLESKILRDRQTFVQLIAHSVGEDLGRTGGIIEYYQTQPALGKILTSPAPEPLAQEWLRDTFFSHPLIDGMFLTSFDGRLVGALPYDQEMIGRDYRSKAWLDGASASPDVFVASVHPRSPDNRKATEIVGAVRGADRKIIGFIGVSVLVERIGRRLSTIEFTDQSTCQILDQDGTPLFTKDFNPNPGAMSASGLKLIERIRADKTGHLEREGNLYSFAPVENTGWTTVVAQPKSVAYKPVHDLLSKMTVLSGWLIALTGIFAWLAGKAYRRQSEAAQRIEREVIFNEKILANMPTGIALVDPETRRFLQANEAFGQMAKRFGNLAPETDVADATYADVKIAPSDAIDKVLSLGAPFQLIEQPLQDGGGATHFVNVNLLRLQDSQQTVQGVLYFVEDKTRDVQQRQELISANASKDQFLALLSHELRNPLSPVLAMVAELEARTSDGPELRQALEVIRRNVELEARLIDALLDVTRISKGKLQLSLEVVCVEEILQRAHEICRQGILAKKLHVEFRLRAARTHVNGDPARLQQVFWNLIKNSVKFTPADGRIIIETFNPTQDQIEIKVTDTGIGIEEEKLGKIFHAFEQGQSSITRRFGGLGLGLAISKAMVKAHGGRISVESAGPDKGATVTVILNTVPAPAESKSPGAKVPGEDKKLATNRAKQRKGRVLVVDDHQDTCIGMKMMLERRGYHVTLAHSADQAVEKARDTKFDLLISDIGLPDRSGYELMEELRAQNGLPGIALSGFGMENDISRARAAGFSDHLTKPINFERLEQAIRNLLEPEPNYQS